MAQTNNGNKNTLRSILEKEKLNGTNFIDWYRNLRIVLKAEKKLYVLEQQIPKEPNSSAPRTERDTFKKHDEDALDVSCLMLITMKPDLQKQHENMGAFDMIEHLKFLFQEQARHERYETYKELFCCIMSEGSPVGTHMLKMIGHIQRLEGLGFSLRKELAIDVVLQSLPNSHSQFLMNYNMHDFDKTLPELLNMLRTAEQELAKNKSTILMVRKDKKRKGKVKSIAKPTSKSLKPKEGIKKSKELKRTRRLSKCEVDLHVGNGEKMF
ncbi:uncharacterized protein LOC112524891 [Cynara cardunculus var. scolymus]|uniref:uncharacterized protein LOC112524891 n=1 Tax=Cynara cardunculus var. scolymus TaxID=59895 RepID=UPI000D62AC98|nr:uncharacterized protein LOC112524891 [Cynara cardunculus var. scolymus]